MVKAKKAAKKAAPKKTAKKRAKRKATPAQLAALAKGRAARAAKKRAKKSAKKAAPKRARKAAPKRAKRATAKKAAPKRAKRAVAKKAAPKRARKRALARRPLIGVPPHPPGRAGMSCVKCGRPHTLREHWSHRLLHGTSETQHSYKCKRGGICEFRALSKSKRKLGPTQRRVSSLATSGSLSIEKQAKLLLLQAKLEAAARRRK